MSSSPQIKFTNYLLEDRAWSSSGCTSAMAERQEAPRPVVPARGVDPAPLSVVHEASGWMAMPSH